MLLILSRILSILKFPIYLDIRGQFDSLVEVVIVDGLWELRQGMQQSLVREKFELHRVWATREVLTRVPIDQLYGALELHEQRFLNLSASEIANEATGMRITLRSTQRTKEGCFLSIVTNLDEKTTKVELIENTSAEDFKQFSFKPRS